MRLRDGRLRDRLKRRADNVTRLRAQLKTQPPGVDQLGMWTALNEESRRTL